MKAALLTAYDKEGRDVEIRDFPVPQIGANDVLVKIRTAGVNPLDNMIIKGEVKMIVPYKMPLVMGNEFVGTVEKVGASVKKFTVGERVYGRMPLDKIGAFAEYAAVSVNAVAKVPEYLSDEEAGLCSADGADRLTGSRFNGTESRRDNLHFRRHGKSRRNGDPRGKEFRADRDYQRQRRKPRPRTVSRCGPIYRLQN